MADHTKVRDGSGGRLRPLQDELTWLAGYECWRRARGDGEVECNENSQARTSVSSASLDDIFIRS
jgi:hypothetical protein